MACKDPSITFLNKFGYNVVKLPRVGIEPLDVIGKDSTTERLGPLAAVWKSSIPVPVPGPPQIAVDVQGQQSDKLDLSIGLKVLANALQAFGATVPSLDFAFTNARKVAFTFTNVTSTSVSPFEAGNFLADGDLNSKNPIVERYFLDTDGNGAQAYLIFDVLKSDSISVSATNDKGVSVKVDVPSIQSVIGANVGVTTADSSSSTLTFQGKTPVTFGFKAMEINFSNGSWKLEDAAADGGLAFSVGAGAAAGAGFPSGGVAPKGVILRSGLLRLH
jgi:hypothetical protein